MIFENEDVRECILEHVRNMYTFQRLMRVNRAWRDTCRDVYRRNYVIFVPSGDNAAFADAVQRCPHGGTICLEAEGLFRVSTTLLLRNLRILSQASAYQKGLIDQPPPAADATHSVLHVDGNENICIGGILGVILEDLILYRVPLGYRRSISQSRNCVVFVENSVLKMSGCLITMNLETAFQSTWLPSLGRPSIQTVEDSAVTVRTHGTAQVGIVVGLLGELDLHRCSLVHCDGPCLKLQNRSAAQIRQCMIAYPERGAGICVHGGTLLMEESALVYRGMSAPIASSLHSNLRLLHNHIRVEEGEAAILLNTSWETLHHDHNIFECKRSPVVRFGECRWLSSGAPRT